METYVVHVTKLCNMNCYYCYEQDKTSTYTWEEVKEYVDKIIENRTDDVFHIEFLGGEPMMAWDIIKKAYEYIEIEYHDVVEVDSYGITNNGTILTDEQAEYLSNNKRLTYAISLDGHKWANQLRVMKDGTNSYDIVIKNIEKCKEYGIDFNVHMTTHPYNIAFLEEGIWHLYDRGVRRFGIGTVESTIDIDEHYGKSFVEKLNRVSKKIVKENIKDIHIDLFEYIKSKDDVRTYIHDENGKLIGESYGRSGSDISDRDDLYNIRKSSGDYPIGELIYSIRKQVYLNHQKNLELYSVEEE